MKFLILLSVFYFCVVQLALAVPNLEKDVSWKVFTTNFGKKFTNKTVEGFRYSVWRANKDMVDKHNADKSKTFKMAIDEYSDLTDEEFAKQRTGLKMRFRTTANSSDSIKIVHKRQSTNPPASFDWRSSSCVTPIKNQGVCGSCWAFASSAALECAYKLKYGTLVNLSEQQFVDCDRKYNKGCNGGWPTDAFDYAKIGIASNSKYPYSQDTYLYGRRSTCKYSSGLSQTKTNPTTAYKDVRDLSETDLVNALVTKGTITIAVCATNSFSKYKNGIYRANNCPESGINHAILLVGYGVDSAGTKFWIAKNSWGTSWGESGYIRIQRGFGLVRYPSYPIIV